MKNIVKQFLAALLLIPFIGAGCSTDQKVTKFNTAGEDAEQAYFANKETSVSLDASVSGPQTVELYLLRQNADKEFTVGLSAFGNVDLITVPETVTFGPGEYKASIFLELLKDEFVPGSEYAVRITVINPEIDPETQSPNQIGDKEPALIFRAALALDWQPCYVLKDYSKLLSTDLTEDDYVLGDDGKPIPQGGVYTYNFWWEGDDDESKLERAVGTNTFRLTNWGGGINLIFSVDSSKTVTVDGKEYASVTVGDQYIGSDHSSYGKVYVCDGQTFDETKFPASSFPSYWDGGQTFVFHMMYFISAGYFDDPALETFVMDAGE